MISAHSWSAAYVLSQQRPEPEVTKPSATYEPACVITWENQKKAMDDTISDLGEVK